MLIRWTGAITSNTHRNDVTNVREANYPLIIKIKSAQLKNYVGDSLIHLFAYLVDIYYNVVVTMANYNRLWF